MSPLFGRRRRERELDEEIRSHFRMAVEERVARGASREEAEIAVRREFGNEARVREVTRTMWGGMWLDRLAQDVRYGVRSLRRDPGFALAAAVILTIGFGVNAIVFTLAKRVLFDAPPAVTAADELVAVTWTHEGGDETVWTYPDYAFVRDGNAAFSGILAYTPYTVATAVASPQGASQADARAVSANFFDVLGSPMALGRGFVSEEGLSPGSHPVVVLSHGFWERYFGADPGIVGRSLSLNGTDFTVVGVTRAAFRGISPVEPAPDVYVPLMMNGTLRAGDVGEWFERREGDISTWLRPVARLADGVSLEAAQANIQSMEVAWHEQFGGWAESTGMGQFRMGVRADYRFTASDADELRRMLGFLAVVVASVLLIACMNVALLLLARAPARQGELSVRTALGAGRVRIVRQLLTEGILLASLGGVGGLLIAYWGSAFVARLMPYSFAADFTPDASVLLYAGTVVVVVAAIFTLAPALQASRSNAAELLRGASRMTRRTGARNLLVVGQVAAAVVLVTGAGLFVRSLQAAQSVDLGFDPDSCLVLSVGLENHGYDETRGRAFLDEVLGRVRALPGVEVAGVTARPPFSGRWSSTVRPEGAEGANAVPLYFNRAGPSYFDAMGIAVVAGRAIGDDDTDRAPPVLMVNETTAERFWPGESAVGKTMEWRDRTWTVVGVAADAKYYTIGDEPVSQVYVSHAQDYDGNATFVVRTSVPPADVAPAVQAIIRNIDDGVAIVGVGALQELVDDQMSTYRALAILVGTIGIIALMMAVLGLYGVLAYLVGQSSREIGIRMALGARGGEVASAVVRRGASIAILGIVIGLAAAWALAGLLRQMLFGVEPQDPLTLVTVAAVLLAVTLLASWVPARRAARVDPMVALREA